MNLFTRNDHGLSRPEVFALKAVKTGLDANVFVDAGPNLARRVLDCLINYGQDGQGKQRAIQEEHLLSALGALHIGDYIELIEKLPELALMGALIDPLLPPEPAESNSAILTARAEV